MLGQFLLDPRLPALYEKLKSKSIGKLTDHYEVEYIPLLFALSGVAGEVKARRWPA